MFPPYGQHPQIRKSIVPEFGEFGIKKSDWLDVSPVSLDQIIHVPNNIDTNIPFTASIFKFKTPFEDMNHRISCKGDEVLSPITIEYECEEKLFDRAYNRIKELPNGWFELWHQDHNVDNGFHFPEPWGEGTELIDHLESLLPIESPLVNHNKLSSRQIDKYDCNRLHFDSFEGMRKTESALQLPVYRYFLNLGDSDRLSLIGVHDKDFIDNSMGNYTPNNYLNPFIEACGRNLPMVAIDTPPRNTHNRTIHGYKILTTHLIHGEFGPKDDYLAIINSLS